MILLHPLQTPAICLKKNKNKTKNKNSSAEGITENINGHKMVIILFFKERCCSPTMWGHPHISTPVQHTKQVLSTLQETVADVPLFPFQFPFAFKCHYFPCLRVCPSPWGVRTSPEPPRPPFLFLPLSTDTFLNVRYLQGHKDGREVEKKGAEVVYAANMSTAQSWHGGHK